MAVRPSAPVQADGQGSGLGVEGGDDPAAAVGHPQLSNGVLATYDPVPDRQLAVFDLEPFGAKPPAGGQQLLAGSVEPIDLAPACGEHDHLLGGVVVGLLKGSPPVLQQREGGGRFGVGGHHSVVGLVGGHRLLHQPAPDEVEGFAFPGLVLAAVLGQFGGAEAKAEGAEAAAGVDRGQLPVVADQDHLALRLVGVLEQAGQLAAAQHAGLIHHQHGPAVEVLLAAVKVSEQPVAGGYVLEPLALEAHGGDPGRGRSQEPIAVQLPGMPGDPEGEGLARSRPPHDEGDALAALAQVPDHRLLILASGRMGGQGIAHRLMGSHSRLLIRPAGHPLDQPLLDREQLRVDQRRSSSVRSEITLTARSAKNRSANSSSTARLAPASLAPRATRTSGRAKVDACSVSPSGPASRSKSGATASPDTLRSWARLAVRPVTVRTRVSGSTPRSAASCRQRLYRVSGVSCCLGLRVAWTAHLTSRGVRSRASATSRSSSASIWPVRLENPRMSAWASLGVRGCRGRPPPSTPRPGSGRAHADRWPGRSRPRPADAGRHRGRPEPSNVRPGPGRDWPPPGGCATADRLLWTSGGRTRPPAPLVRTRAGHHRVRAEPQVLVQVADRLGQPGMMGGQHRPSGRWVAQAVEDRDALGRPQHHVKGGHSIPAMGTAQQLPRRGVPALKHGLELGHGCFAPRPKAHGAGAVPPAWGLTVAR
jgi:hypothetical protein